MSRLPGNRARPVLRGPRRSNAPGLPDERWFADLTNRKLRRSTHCSVKAVEDDGNNWIAAWNDNPKPFVWAKTVDQILDNLANYCTRINKASNNRTLTPESNSISI
ncbi:hypothetical protein [Micromonospora sp. NPDC048830]|uniref:hypothetical protein n=1 Tax=Micromonospora sp. NPDC048830 TaxID=3364257 RepID=UPI00371EF233